MEIKNIKSKIISLFFVFIVTLLVGCNQTETNNVELVEEPYSQTEFMMGTYVSVQIYDKDQEKMLETAFDRVIDLDKKLAPTEPDSEIYAVNQAAGKEVVKVSDDVYRLIEKSVEYSEIREDGFDYTIGPITELWRIGFDDARVPDQEEIDEVLPLVDHNEVELDAEEKTVFLKQEGMKIDLGAIAKGYIADEMIKALKDDGVTTAIVDLGGNVVVMGDSPKRENGGFNVGIQDPLDTRGQVVGSIKAKDQSIVTSGVYERYIEEDGEIYHHLMNPETGYPFDNSIAGVTIISDESIDGDAFSTVVFAFGLEDGLEYVNELDGLEAIFVSKDKEVYTSDGITEEFNFTHEEYNWINE